MNEKRFCRLKLNKRSFPLGSYLGFLLMFFFWLMCSRWHLKSALRWCCSLWLALSSECKTFSLRLKILAWIPQSSNCSDLPRSLFPLWKRAFCPLSSWFFPGSSLFRHKTWICLSCSPCGKFTVDQRLRLCRNFGHRTLSLPWVRCLSDGLSVGWLPCRLQACILSFQST